MKKVLWCMLCLIVLIGLAINIDSRVYDKRNRIFCVDINTMTWTVGGGWLPGRVYYHVDVQSTQYDVRRISWNADTSTVCGKILRAPDGSWIDRYNVYKSSWYYIIDGGGPADVAAYSATICYHEKD